MRNRFFALFFVLVATFAANRTIAVNHDVTWDFSPAPSRLTIKVGDTVTWNGNLDFHPIAQTNASFASGQPTISSGGSSFVRTFNSVGTFYFVCNVHNAMRTTVVVCTPPANPAVLDIDGNGQVTAATDGLLVVRYILGMRGDSLVNGAIGECPGRDTSAIETYLASRVVP
jgi:plastocyanin